MPNRRELAHAVSYMSRLKRRLVMTTAVDRAESEHYLLQRRANSCYIGERQQPQLLLRLQIPREPKLLYRVRRLLEMTEEELQSRLGKTPKNDWRTTLDYWVRRRLRNVVDPELRKLIPAVVDQTLRYQVRVPFMAAGTTRRLWIGQELPVMVTDLNPSGNEALEIQLGSTTMFAKRSYSIDLTPRLSQHSSLPEPNRVLSQVPAVFTNFIHGPEGWYCDLLCHHRTTPGSGVWRPKVMWLVLWPTSTGMNWAFDNEQGHLTFSEQPPLTTLMLMMDCAYNTVVEAPANGARWWPQVRRVLFKMAYQGRTRLQWVTEHKTPADDPFSWLLKKVPRERGSVEYWLDDCKFTKSSYFTNKVARTRQRHAWL